MLMELHYLVRVVDKLRRHLRDMNQTILVNTNIDKGTKLGDVGNDAWYHHSYLNILKLMDVVRE